MDSTILEKIPMMHAPGPRRGGPVQTTAKVVHAAKMLLHYKNFVM